MSSAGQQVVRDEGILASRAAYLYAETTQEYPQASYNRARYYDPSDARFLSEDAVRFNAGFNFYTYVGNSPVNLADPSGLCPNDKVPCYANVRKFVNSNLAAAKTLASELPGVTPQEILAVAGGETTFGSAQSLAPHGNYFGLHGTGFAGQTGSYTTQPKDGSQGVLTPVFPLSNGFLLSGQVFVNTEAQYLNGTDLSDPATFFNIISQHGYGTDRKDSYVNWMMLNKPTKHGPYALIGACMAAQ